MAKKVSKRAKKEAEKIDGISAKDKQRIRNALRSVWRYSYPWKIVVNRCLLPNGFSKCELCKKVCPKIYVDHISKVGEVDDGMISRMFIPSNKLQGLCKKCHDKKTAEERKGPAKAPKKLRKKKEVTIKDFY